MNLQSLSQFYNLRSSCLCNHPLYSTFLYSSYDDDYISVKPLRSHEVDKAINTGTIKFSFQISSNIVPYGETYFYIIADIKSSTFKYYIESNKSTDPNVDLVKYHFGSPNLQNSLNIKICLKCSDRMNINCVGVDYNLHSGNIIFDFNTMTVTATNINEIIKLHACEIKTNINDNETTFSYHSLKEKNMTFKMNAEKFLSIPFTKDHLAEKIKLYSVFS